MSNLDLVRQSFDAYAAGDLPRALSVLADDVEWLGVEPGPLDIHGRDDVERRLQERLAVRPPVEVVEFEEEGGRVVLHTRDGSGIDYYTVVTVRDGKIARIQDTPSHDAALRLARA